MPYISQLDRNKYDWLISELASQLKSNGLKAGDLNYIFTKLILKSHENETMNYDQYNKIMGMLNCVSMEFYRRQVVSYEENKIKENGDL